MSWSWACRLVNSMSVPMRARMIGMRLICVPRAAEQRMAGFDFERLRPGAVEGLEIAALVAAVVVGGAAEEKLRAVGGAFG